jgi:transposase
MFHMNQNLKVVLAVEPVDLRKSFNGLYEVARNELGDIPENGALFIFSNRSHNRIKVLCFDGTGCWVSVKRLEQGTFSCEHYGSSANKFLATRTQGDCMLKASTSKIRAHIQFWGGWTRTV